MSDTNLQSSALTVSIHRSISGIRAADWDACACPEAPAGGRADNPFATHRFLKALEDSGSVGEAAGWLPFHARASRGRETVAVMPLYAKFHSRGEYIFDAGWAHAFEQAGGRYYPKLQSTIPFTPATGRRFMARAGQEQAGFQLLATAAIKLLSQNELSSLHITFCTEEEAMVGKEAGFLHRTGEQFHWFNAGYGGFDDFLRALSARKRKNIKRERRRANAFGGSIEMLTGADIEPGHWDAFWEFYQETGTRKWGTPYLTRRFFDEIHTTMRNDILLVMCRRDGRYIAGALNFIGNDALYGRYWGCVEDHSCLHFEVCYYRAIEYAIDHGLCRIEAGAQGLHKLARGYMPAKVHSLHWIANQGFRQAVLDYLQEENRDIDRELDFLSRRGPFRKGNHHAGSAH